MREKRLPLKGQHVLITRGGDRGEQFCTDVASAGGVPHMIPLIDFRPHEDMNAPIFISNMKQYDWIIFTSKNGVDHFFRHIKDRVDLEELRTSRTQFAVVGEKTRAALDRYRLPSKFMPNVYTAEDFAREFFDLSLTGHKVLIPKGNLASNTIAESFRKRSIIADEWIVYDTYYPTEKRDELITMLKEGVLDVAAFTSPSTFNHFLQVVKENHLEQYAKHLIMASIGTVTKRTIEEAGYTVSICPKTFTIDHMFDELCQYFVQNEHDEKGKVSHGFDSI